MLLVISHLSAIGVGVILGGAASRYFVSKREASEDLAMRSAMSAGFVPGGEWNARVSYGKPVLDEAADTIRFEQHPAHERGPR